MEPGAKKKLADAVSATGGVTDPLADMEVDAEAFDVKRIASIYASRDGERWWTKAWFNGREKGEPAKEVTSRQLIISFVKGRINRDQWLTQFYPKQMQICNNAVEKTRQQLLSL